MASNVASETIWPVFNLLGVLVPLGFSLGIARYHEERYFRCWTSSYAYALIALALDFLAAPAGHPVAVTTLEIVTYLASAWNTLETSRAMVGFPVSPRKVLAAMAGCVLFYLGASFAGQPFDNAVVPTILFYIATQVVLGVQLIRDQSEGAELRAVLGSFVIVTGLWVLAYPVLAKTPYLWLGFAVAGLLHLLVGFGMVIYLLSDVARQLRRQNEELKIIDRLQYNFIGTMSHEFRTPLNAIQSGAWLLGNLKGEHLTGRQQEIVEIISINAVKAITLVDDVLDYSKIESGTMAYEIRPTDLGDLAREVTRSLSQLFDEKAILLELDLPQAPLVVPVDAKRIGQALGNLLTNASKFTPTGGHVTVRLATDGGNARLEVQDDGIGVESANRERIFMRFYQVDGTSTRRAGGTGLGLAISRAIVVEGHGGNIYVRENDGPGATFVLELPLTTLAEERVT
jgi:signal transduction histidine kinase